MKYPRNPETFTWNVPVSQPNLNLPLQLGKA